MLFCTVVAPVYITTEIVREGSLFSASSPQSLLWMLVIATLTGVKHGLNTVLTPDKGTQCVYIYIFFSIKYIYYIYIEEEEGGGESFN